MEKNFTEKVSELLEDVHLSKRDQAWKELREWVQQQDWYKKDATPK